MADYLDDLLEKILELDQEDAETLADRLREIVAKRQAEGVA